MKNSALTAHTNGRPHQAYRRLKAAGYDQGKVSIEGMMRTMVKEGLLEIHPGGTQMYTLFGLPGIEPPPTKERIAQRRRDKGQK